MRRARRRSYVLRCSTCSGASRTSPRKSSKASSAAARQNNESLLRLTDGIDKLVQQMRAEQKVLREWVDEQVAQSGGAGRGSERAEQARERAARDRRPRSAPRLRSTADRPAKELTHGLSRSRRRASGIDYWPGFVDALSTLLLVVTFLMVLFMVAQYFVAQEATEKTRAGAAAKADRANGRSCSPWNVAEEIRAEDEASSLRATLAAVGGRKEAPGGAFERRGSKGSSAEARVAAVTKQLDDQRGLTAQALAQIELLNQQIVASA